MKIFTYLFLAAGCALFSWNVQSDPLTNKIDLDLEQRSSSDHSSLEPCDLLSEYDSLVAESSYFSMDQLIQLTQLSEKMLDSKIFKEADAASKKGIDQLNQSGSRNSPITEKLMIRLELVQAELSTHRYLTTELQGVRESTRGFELIPDNAEYDTDYQEIVGRFDALIEKTLAKNLRGLFIYSSAAKAEFQRASGNLVQASQTYQSIKAQLSAFSPSSNQDKSMAAESLILAELYISLVDSGVEVDTDELQALKQKLNQVVESEEIHNAAPLYFLSHIEEMLGQPDSALELASRSFFEAQQDQRFAANYIALWQTARLLAQKGQKELAETFYQLAIRQFNLVDKTFFVADPPRPLFARFPENTFLDLAKLHITNAVSAPNDSEKQIESAKARTAIENYKKTQFDRIFLNARCDTLLGDMAVSIEEVIQNLDAETSVIYMIPTDDRIELMACFKGGVVAINEVPVSLKGLKETCNDLFMDCKTVDPNTNFDTTIAKSLYDLLIRPIEGELSQRGIKKLALIPQGPLGNVPFGALHDGKAFLIESFAISEIPNITLLKSDDSGSKQSRVLIGGLTDQDLQYVQSEIDGINKYFPSTSQLSGKDFSVEELKSLISQNRFNVIHFATHAFFGGSPDNTYFKTNGENLYGSEFAELLYSNVLSETPLDLLTLSACQTAVEDENTGAGLANIAIQSGARSVIATRWNVNDESISLLMQEFYRAWKQEGLSKTEALQKAQIFILKNERFDGHPVHWAPTVLIGNWN